MPSLGSICMCGRRSQTLLSTHAKRGMGNMTGRGRYILWCVEFLANFEDLPATGVAALQAAAVTCAVQQCCELIACIAQHYGLQVCLVL